MFEPIGTVLPVTTFAAVCETCDWISEPVASNLRALAIFDRHVASAAHRGRAADMIDSDEETDFHEAELEARRAAYQPA